MTGYQASPALCAFIRSKAPAHIVDVNGPRNWAELQATQRGPIGPLPVNPFGAEGSIYGDIATNIAFRAWHDTLHLQLDADFGSAGEYVVALEHRRLARAAGLPESDIRALWADTWETFCYAARHNGEFPTNPRAFVAQCLEATQHD